MRGPHKKKMVKGARGLNRLDSLEDDKINQLYESIQELSSDQKAKLLSKVLGVTDEAISFHLGSNNNHSVDAENVYQFNVIGADSMTGILEAIVSKIDGYLPDKEDSDDRPIS